MWFITLIVLAIAAVLVIKAVKAQSNRRAASEAESSSTPGLQGQLNRDHSSQGVAETQSAANDALKTDSSQSEASHGNAQSSATEAAAPARNQQEELQEIREMIKILNLAEADSGRLNISAEQFNVLRAENSASVDASAMPSSEAQADIADRLRRMLA